MLNEGLSKKKQTQNDRIVVMIKTTMIKLFFSLLYSLFQDEWQHVFYKHPVLWSFTEICLLNISASFFLKKKHLLQLVRSVIYCYPLSFLPSICTLSNFTSLFFFIMQLRNFFCRLSLHRKLFQINKYLYVQFVSELFARRTIIMNKSVIPQSVIGISCIYFTN